ncbi:zinc metallopeptidase [Thalassoroseus pseudoceratinae]|uniref:zinc metallopeptidase n=1 Tax=Thalassoroseus pseudoceratinae TaxID=2713176 RepID=UPI00141F1FAB|nr:zinc metallopeptidase [Thalassoroseus pseudoceratinae]
MFFDPLYFLFIAPAMLLMLWAQYRIKSTYHSAMQVDARLTGAAAARYILDQAGLHNVTVEQTPGHLSDHYDPRGKVLRLSPEVFNSRSAAAVGIAAHEAGHALQDAKRYAPLVVRNIAVPAAQFGPMAFFGLVILGFLLQQPALIYLGIAAYGGLVFFQLVNLPVEFDASNRAKKILTDYQIVDQQGAVAVRKVLNAAGWTYVAATLQSVLTLIYYIFRLTGGSND